MLLDSILDDVHQDWAFQAMNAWADPKNKCQATQTLLQLIRISEEEFGETDKNLNALHLIDNRNISFNVFHQAHLQFTRENQLKL